MVHAFRLIDGAAAEEWADRLLRTFGSLPAAMAAHPASLARVLDAVEPTALVLVSRALMLRVLETEALTGPLLPTTSALIDYLHASMSWSPVEQMRGLFLDARNRLIRDEILSTGSVGETGLYVREIIRRALDVNATAMLLVHNHPSGDHEPSPADIEMTRDLSRALRGIGVVLHDHLIIGRAGWSSLRALNVL